MKLFSDESKELCATNFWVVFNNERFLLPVPHEESGNIDSPADLNQVNGTYHVFSSRIEDNQLNWVKGDSVVVRDGQPAPEDGEYHNYEHKFSIVVSDLEHDGVSITKNANIESIAMDKMGA